MSKFFINRPIVAMVIAILTVIVGAVTIVSLPVAQFPNIVPAEINLRATYVGADALALEQSVATPIEQQVNGVDNMVCMYSINRTGDSRTILFAVFDVKTDPNMDLILMQSRENLASSQLPPEVNTYGVTIKKATTAPIMVVAIYSPHGSRDVRFLANYAHINLNDPIARLYGVGQAENRVRRRVRGTPGHGHHGDWRHGGRHRHRHLFHPGKFPFRRVFGESPRWRT
jgi:HAE1 family hydrophobic/amphiphilic exporter-1